MASHSCGLWKINKLKIIKLNNKRPRALPDLLPDETKLPVPGKFMLRARHMMWFIFQWHFFSKFGTLPVFVKNM